MLSTNLQVKNKITGLIMPYHLDKPMNWRRQRKINMLNMSDIFFVLENTLHNSDILELSGCFYKTY